MSQKTLKWTPVQSMKRSDNIMSSKARETGNTGFVPSYLSEPREKMGHIMSNEYMRMWFKERGKFEKITYTRLQIIKEESKIQRRSVQRMMTYREPNKNRFIDDKCENIANKIPTRDKHVDYSKFKYKPYCPKQKQPELTGNDAASTSVKTIKADSNKDTRIRTAAKESPKEESQPSASPCCPCPAGTKKSPQEKTEENTEDLKSPSCCCAMTKEALPKDSPKKETENPPCCCSTRKLTFSKESLNKETKDPCCCCPTA